MDRDIGVGQERPNLLLDALCEIVRRLQSL
jgi:hypothetical protein